MFISQTSYIGKALQKFSMSNPKVIATLLAQHFRLLVCRSPDTKEELAKLRKVSYANAVGSVICSMVCTRPDLSYALSMINRFMTNLGRAH